ncbi:hypothetical protein ScPMuIL_003515 [Solemya velum]
MPSESSALPAQTEKPHHYMYLKEFRTQQCQLFLQHKCTQHRPFTCFHWHFMNQRRRRPVRKRDGTFNYSPDVYCTKFDETTGMCPAGDECQFLHRTAGDTERRYHLRYYKTGTCVYETDSKGHCVKNGPHCAFAHGAHDLRPPVYDIRELQTIEVPEKLSTSSTSGTPSSLEKDKFLAEDPKWNDTNYVLTNYKTEQCKRPPRLCRQGYACPQYHNTRDRRRSPKKYKYRSTPCPNVKHGDDWGDPTQCEGGDNCAYCHTRTEQQFHPEIYKSTKCNDMVQTGYCPRGPFCAFAHVEHEMTSQREVTATTENSLAAFVSTVLPQTCIEDSIANNSTGNHNQKEDEKDIFQGGQVKLLAPIGKERSNSVSTSNGNSVLLGSLNEHIVNSFPEPIGKGRSSSMASSFNSDGGFTMFPYQRAPGSEREDLQLQSNLRHQLTAIDSDNTIDPTEKSKRKQNLMLLHNLSISGPPQGSVPSTQCSVTSMSPLAPAFYPPRDTVAGVVGHALEELCIDDIDINSIDKELDHDNDTNSLSSSLSAGIPTGFATSVPIGIPNTGIQRGSVGSLSQSPPSPYGSFSATLLPILSKQEAPADQTYYGHSNTSKQLASLGYNDVNSMSPRSGPGNSHSPFYNSHNDIQRLREEIQHNKNKVEHMEHAYTQAKSAPGGHLKPVKSEVDGIGSNQFARHSARINELENIPIQQLYLLKQQLQLDLSNIDRIIQRQSGMMGLKCVGCSDKKNVVLLPCNHCAMCDNCSVKSSECPYCHAHVPRPLLGTGYHL